jgi:hypothetical protein
MPIVPGCWRPKHCKHAGVLIRCSPATSYTCCIRSWLMQARLIDCGLSLPTSARPHPSGTLAFMAVGRHLGHGIRVSHELEAVMYCLIFWACSASLPWRHALGGHQSLHWKWTSMTLEFEVSWLELYAHTSDSSRLRLPGMYDSVSGVPTRHVCLRLCHPPTVLLSVKLTTGLQTLAGEQPPTHA